MQTFLLSWKRWLCFPGEWGVAVVWLLYQSLGSQSFTILQDVSVGAAAVAVEAVLVSEVIMEEEWETTRQGTASAGDQWFSILANPWRPFLVVLFLKIHRQFSWLFHLHAAPSLMTHRCIASVLCVHRWFQFDNVERILWGLLHLLNSARSPLQNYSVMNEVSRPCEKSHMQIFCTLSLVQ